MLSSASRKRLGEDAQLLPLVEQLAECVESGSPILSIKRAAIPAYATPGWMVFCDPQQLGIAVNLQGVVPSRTNLRLRLHIIQYARRIIDSFGGREQFPLRLIETDMCPTSWIGYEVYVPNGAILCAVSLPPPLLLPASPLAACRTTRVQRVSAISVNFVGYARWCGIVSVGETQVMGVLKVECPQQRLWGEITVSEGGIMRVQREDPPSLKSEGAGADSDSVGVLVRFDIGDVELLLHELAALRSGATIELEADLPLRCFMRVGSTTIAQGELSLGERGLMLLVTEVAG
jgi:flagellar motor switch/type III secretory pathway protein FliN